MKMKLTFPKVKKGGPGSGDFGHTGRPGQIGGSSGGGGGENFDDLYETKLMNEPYIAKISSIIGGESSIRRIANKYVRETKIEFPVTEFGKNFLERILMDYDFYTTEGNMMTNGDVSIRVSKPSSTNRPILTIYDGKN